MKPRSPNRLALEITVVLTVKFALLWLIWLQWFSYPVAEHMYIAAPQVQQHFFPSSQSHSSP